MCGIAGVFAWHDRFRTSREMLSRMSACIAHRGPDDQGTFFNHEAEPSPTRPQIAFAHRRLAILDPDPRANQPLTDGQGRWIILNGEIYNYRELKAELTARQPRQQWRTTGDTEVLLAAYATWGIDCLQRLNGLYAFAIWSEEDGLFLARDRMGQKPLYIAQNPAGAFAFASELPALRVLPWVSTAMDVQSLADYLTWGFCPRGSIHQGITKLAPATWMMVRPGGIESQKYFDPNHPPSAPLHSHEATVARTRELVTQAARRQLVADVPLGCFLSGGVDSSVIAAAMRQAVTQDQPVLTFSIGFDDPRYDETRHAAAIAAHLKTEHRQFIVRPNAAEDLPKLAAVFGEPFADSSALPTHYLSRETRRHVTVALSGDGGDELFGGYDRYRAMALGQRLASIPRRMLRWTAALRRFPGSHPKSRLAKLKRFAATLDLPPAQRYASYLRFFDAPAISALLKPDLLARDGSETILTSRYDQFLASGRDVVQAALAIDRELYLPEDLLTKVDRCSMLHALEVRGPFMDHDLVQFAASLTTAQLLRGGAKWMLREAFARDLPPFVFRRKKMGFAVPIGEWFRGELRPMLHDSLFSQDSFASTHFHLPVVRKLIDEHESGIDHSQRLYALLMLELWRQESRGNIH